MPAEFFVLIHYKVEVLSGGFYNALTQHLFRHGISCSTEFAEVYGSSHVSGNHGHREKLRAGMKIMLAKVSIPKPFEKTSDWGDASVVIIDHKCLATAFL